VGGLEPSSLIEVYAYAYERLLVYLVIYLFIYLFGYLIIYLAIHFRTYFTYCHTNVYFHTYLLIYFCSTVVFLHVCAWVFVLSSSRRAESSGINGDRAYAISVRRSSAYSEIHEYSISPEPINVYTVQETTLSNEDATRSDAPTPPPPRPSATMDTVG